MTPDTLEPRMAALKQQVLDLADDVRALVNVTAQQAVFAEQLLTVRENLAAMRRDLDGLHDAFRNFKDTLAQREASQTQERKLDRRWMVGTILASTSVIIAALGIVASVLG